MELCYDGLRSGDFVEVEEEHAIVHNLPVFPWNDQIYTYIRRYGRVVIKLWPNGSRAELMFVSRGGWSRSLDSFARTRKITEHQMIEGIEYSESYEKDEDGVKQPVGTARRIWVEKNCNER